MSRTRWSVPVVVGLLASSLVGFATPASAFSSIIQPNIVSAVPATNTPDLNDGVVAAITQVGGTMYIGGTFTSISTHGSSTAVTANYIAAFNPNDGSLVSSFAPTLNGEVQSLTPGPAPGEIYVGGKFTTANGQTTHVTLLNTSNGSTVSTWKPSTQNGIIAKVDYVPNVDNTGTPMTFIGGSFSTVGGVAHGALAALDPNTGKVLPYVGLSFTGHHNFGVNCNPPSGCASGAVGIRDMDIDASGTHLVAIGNFNNVSGTAHDQLALIDFGTSSASVDPNFNTLAYTAACFAGSFDTYVRGVSFSPNGAYFVVVATGGSGTNKDGTNSSCDTAARFETTASGSNIRPTWIDYTGQDTLLTVAITNGVVYVGGHQRWLNNSKGHDNPGAGSVPRPGLGALDPTSGMPFAWNPGREPRGIGTSALYLTSSGLWIGADTDWIGDRKYHHKKLAFFPLGGGEAFPNESVGGLPGNVFTVGGLSGLNANQFLVRHFDGNVVGSLQSLSNGVSWGNTRGAFMVGNELIYGQNDGNLYERSFDGTTLGSETLIDPYNDPAWDNVQTDSGQTYRGLRSGLAAELPSVTSMFFTNGRLYYTMSTSSSMHWRWFEPDDGIVGSDEFTVNDGHNWSNAAGAFVSGNKLYYADKVTGALFSMSWNGTQVTGLPSLVNATQNWAGRSLIVVSDPVVQNQPPVAHISSNCTNLTCTFDGSGSTDSDGHIQSYSWDFGDGTTDAGATPQPHTYANAGTYQVTLTVTDDDNATDSDNTSVTVSPPVQDIGFVGANAVDKSGTSESVAVPAGAAVGDTLLLFESHGTAGVTATPPAGWTQIGTTSKTNLISTVWEKTATASDLGSSPTVGFSTSVKAVLAVADYANTASNPIESVASSTQTSTTTHTTPALSGLSNGSWVVSFWTDRSTTTTHWTPAAAVTKRTDVYGTGGGAVSALLADSAGEVSGSYPSQTSTTDATSGTAAQYAIALAPAASP